MMKEAIIEDLSFTIPEGSITLLLEQLVQKSTTANLLLRYYNVTAGNQIEMKIWRKLILLL